MASGPTASARASSESKVGSSTKSKATLVRLGVRGFNPKLKKAAERLEGLRTPEGEPIPPNTLSELYRDMERRRLVRDQIRQIESARLDRLEHAPGEEAHAMVRLLARVMGIGIETADMLVREVLSRNLRDRRAVARCATGCHLTSSRTRAASSFPPVLRRYRSLRLAFFRRARRQCFHHLTSMRSPTSTSKDASRGDADRRRATRRLGTNAADTELPPKCQTAIARQHPSEVVDCRQARSGHEATGRKCRRPHHLRRDR